MRPKLLRRTSRKTLANTRGGDGEQHEHRTLAVELDAEEAGPWHRERGAQAEDAAVPEHEAVHEDGERQRRQGQVDAAQPDDGQGHEHADGAG